MPTSEEDSLQCHPTLSDGAFLIPMSSGLDTLSLQNSPHILFYSSLYSLLVQTSALDYSLPLANTNHKGNGYYWVRTLCLHFNGLSVNDVLIHSKDSSGRNSRCSGRLVEVIFWGRSEFWCSCITHIPLAPRLPFLGSASSTDECFWLFLY